uniref:BRCT domain-containing protein n=1 Tax=Anopheles farauti TaxID=69004 RepID=A0A182Q1M5_9DIPT
MINQQQQQQPPPETNMDLGSTAATTAAAAAATQQASTGVVEKPCAATEEPENPAVSGKNGSVPDSSADSTKDKACVSISPAKTKEVLSPSPKQASNDDVVVKACELNSTVVDSLKSPSKQPVTTSTSVDAVGQETKPKDKEPAKSDKTLDTVECNDNPVDPEDDDLLRRMEAIEKGEDLDLVNEKEDAKKASSNHQNGMPEQEESTKKQTETTLTVKPIDTTVVTEKSSQSSDISVAKQNPSTSDVKVASETVSTKSAEEAVNSNAKRKHLLNEVESNEPEVKKVHVSDVTDASGKTNIIAQSCDRTENTAPPPVPSEPELEKPPSVEKMEVDGSPEPEPSKEVDVLPADTKPNTATESVAMEEKSEEISSSVAEEPMRLDSDTSASVKADNSNVSSSSDDKRETGSEKPNVSDSEVSASVLPAPSEEEAMDVDEDVSDMAESSTSAGGGPSVPAPIPVVEPPCVKKFAYQCTEDEPKADEVTKKDTVVSTAAVSATSSTADSAKMEVDSGAKASSTKAVGAKTLAQGEDEVDSSNVATSVPEVAILSAADKVTESGKTSKADESAVESSQPSSSSDTKKKLEHRLNEQLREAVHRSGLLAKATSTPNSSAVVITPSSSHPSTPKTQTPVTTSAVSSSNVYSSTPIHPNCGKVGSGNVSKITNPPSSVETSRIETDDTVTATTTATNTSSTSITDKSSSLEEKQASTAPSAASKAETESLPTTVSAGTSDSSAKSSSSQKKELRKDDSSSSLVLQYLSSAAEVDSCTVGSDMNTTEEINLYISNARKLNGISSTSEGTDVESKPESACKASGVAVKQEEDSKAGVSSVHLDLSHAIAPTTSAEQQYEVCVWYEGKELQFMSVERIVGGGKVDSSVVADPATHDSSTIIDSSSKQSSSATTNGSVSSLGPFTLPTSGKPANVGQTSDSSSSSVATVTGTKLVHSLSVPQMKQTIMGPKALCDLIIDEFKKLRRTIAPDDEDAPEAVDDTLLGVKSPKTPAVIGGRGRTKESAKKSASRGQKRSKAVDSDDDDEAGVTSGTPRTGGSSSASKQPAKRTKGGSTESPVTTSSVTPKSKAVPEPKDFDICCLARWTDRKYYAGRVTNYRGDNKYVVRFEDGCSKTLSRDIIVFGEDGVLPIKHHSIHALTGGDTYEPAIVEEIKRNEANEVVYGVRTASSNLEVTATDIYLTDEQAKWIHNACKDKPDPIQAVGGGVAGEGGDASVSGGSVADGNTIASDALLTESGEKGSRATRSKRGAGSSDKSMTATTPEAGYSGGVGKKGRRGRRKQLLPPEPSTSEYSDASDNYDDEVPIPTSPDTGLDAVDGVQPELQRTEQESELARMYLVSAYFGNGVEDSLDELLGPIPVNSKTLFRNKHFLLTCTVPPKAVSHEWIIQCCQVLTLVDVKPYVLPAGWSFVEGRFIEWGCGRAKNKRTTATPFASVSVNVASLCKDFNNFWSRVCKLAGATVRLIKTEYDVTENLTGYLLTDQEFPEEIKIKAARNGLLVVSTVWVVQCLISGQVCHPNSNEKLTQIYQEDDY